MSSVQLAKKYLIIRGWQGLFFQDTPSYSGTKASKNACVTENERV